jgi:alpha-tubulin suppressor-like RCC1 family protein
MLGRLLARGALVDASSKRLFGRFRWLPAVQLLAVLLAAASIAPGYAVASGTFAWGEGEAGQLGNAATQNRGRPVRVRYVQRNVTAISAGRAHSLALLTNGTVKAWGENQEGQLGDGISGAEASSNVAVSVTGLSGATAISAGADHSLALLQDGTVMAWGKNRQGQLGNGNTVASAVPVTVRSLAGVVAISAGGDHSLALLENGTVMAWGDNHEGQLGTGNTRNSSLPVAVRGLSGVAAVSAGANHSLALLENGTVMAWGDNHEGQLGTGTTSNSTVPVTVSGLSGVNVKAISAGGEHSLALRRNGTMLAWGSDEYGQLGNGAATSSDVPVNVRKLSGATAISAGGRHSLALLSDGTVMAWGDDTFGQLGNGANGDGENSDLPVPVSELTGMVAVSAGSYHSLAYGPPTTTTSGEPMPVGDIPGWHQVFADDFTINASLGSWATDDAGSVVYVGDHGGKWQEYPDGWPCNPYPNCYEPSKVLSAHDGVLDFWLHNVKYANGSVGPAGANPSPILPSGSQYQTYGRYVARFKVVYGDSRQLDQYHIAWLLWPNADSVWRSAESDFPEADLSQTTVCAFAHFGLALQDSFCVPIDFSRWHTYTQQWGPGYRNYYLDGKLIGMSTNLVYSERERWQLQTEAHSKEGDTTSGHLLVDWVAVYAPA